MTRVGPAEANAPAAPPVAERRPVRRSHHGREFIDDYEWMRAKESPETLAYLEAENAWTAAATAHLNPLVDTIFDEIKGRIRETDMSVPIRIRDHWYFVRTVEGASYGISCRVPAVDTDPADPAAWEPPTVEPGVALPGEEVLLDGNELAEGHEFFAVGVSAVSHAGDLLAYSTDVTGDERYTLRIKDLRGGGLLDDVIEDIAPGAVWSADDRFLFYTTVDEAWRPDAVWRHRVGTDRSADVRVLHEPDDRYWVGVGRTRSKRFMEIGIASKITTESWYLDASDPEGEFVCVRPREEGVEYDVEHAVVGGVDTFLVTHNAAGENFEIGVSEGFDLSGLGSLAELPALVAHDEATRVEGIDAFADHLVISHRRDVLSRLAVIRIRHDARDRGATAGDVEGIRALFDEPVEFAAEEELFTQSLGATPDFDAPLLRFGYGSFVTPTTVSDHVLATGENIVRKRQVVLGGHDPADYESFRLWATAPDGVRVPMSVVRRRGVHGPAPTLLYGYGSYEASMDPAFSVARLSLLDRGMVFVVAHVRGGGELGRAWYEGGKKLTKTNTFTDFVACADALIEGGHTTPGMLVASGGSAGGLLMGAVANSAGDRFAGIHAAVPFVDPLTSILMPELPLTVIEWDEWGNPLEDPEVYDYMAGYSPYENVRAQDYPAILALAGLHDTRVLYVEPAKWVAKLRATATSAADPRRPILLKTEMSAGHGGVSGRYEKWRETAFEYAWILDIAGAAGNRVGA